MTLGDRALLENAFDLYERVWGEAWGYAAYTVTRPVTGKAMIRVCADFARVAGIETRAGK